MGGNVIIHIAYVALSSLIIWLLIRNNKTQHKFVAVVIGGWIMMGTVLGTPMFIIKIPGISFFEIQPKRLIMLLFTAWLARDIYLDIKNRSLRFKEHIPLFIIFLFSHIVLSAISYYKNQHFVGSTKMIVEITILYGAMITFIVMRKTVDKEMIKFLCQIMITTGILTVLVSLIQLAEPTFFRIGDQRAAFGPIYRANGVFSQEYYNSAFLIITIFWTLICVPKFWVKWGLTGLFLFGILITFHRMSYIIVSLLLVIYLLRVERVPIAWMSLLAMGGIVLGLTVANLFAKDIAQSSVVQERMNEGIDKRFMYYEMVFRDIPKRIWWGFGTIKNRYYYYAMLEITGNILRAEAAEGNIHNGYLETLYRNGLPSLIVFLGFIITTIMYFWSLPSKHIIYGIPLAAIVLFTIANLTNSFLYHTFTSYFILIHLAIGLAIKEKQIFGPPIPNQLKTQLA